MSTRRAARRLADEAQAILEGAGIKSVGLTDPRRAADALTSGHVVVTVNPPTVTYSTWVEVDAEWQAWVIAGPAQATDEAWDALDAARDLLVEPLEVDTATPTEFLDAQGTGWPALVLAFTSHHDKE